jgi:hypothetical protein
MEDTMKQLASMAIVLAVAVPLVACGNSSSGSGNGSSGGGSAPSISITMPAANAMVTLTKPMDNVPVAFTVQNFTMVNAGDASCANTSNNCGHVHLLVDGSACTPAGMPYNNWGYASPINAVLSSCPMANGMHTVTLELHHNDHSPVLDASMNTISTHVAFTATGG